KKRAGARPAPTARKHDEGSRHGSVGEGLAPSRPSSCPSKEAGGGPGPPPRPGTPPGAPSLVPPGGGCPPPPPRAASLTSAGRGPYLLHIQAAWRFSASVEAERTTAFSSSRDGSRPEKAPYMDARKSFPEKDGCGAAARAAAKRARPAAKASGTRGRPGRAGRRAPATSPRS